MTIGVDNLSCHINPLIHKHLVIAFTLRSDDVRLKYVDYSYDVFFTCSNSRYE